MKKIKILDCTLRDGTYVLNFMIEPEVFYHFTNELIKIGYQHIEVGHGLGVGAWRTYSSGFNDKELWQKLEPLSPKAKLFSFFIPYVGTLEDVDIAVDHGLYGLRVGMEPVFINKYIHTLESLKKKGLHLSLNLMKSYVVTPKTFAKIAEDVKDIVDVVYLVDSAGCLLPNEIKRYIEAVHEKCGMIPLGYHGHNNLGLAVATALELIDMGVEYIDTTLTGIGRSGGNVPTETMIAILAKKYNSSFFNNETFLKTINVANQFKSYVESKGINIAYRSDDILFGYSGFHSSFEKKVRDFADKYGLDFSRTIIDISEKERINVTDQILKNYLNDFNSLKNDKQE